MIPTTTQTIAFQQNMSMRYSNVSPSFMGWDYYLVDAFFYFDKRFKRHCDTHFEAHLVA